MFPPPAQGHSGSVRFREKHLRSPGQTKSRAGRIDIKSHGVSCSQAGLKLTGRGRSHMIRSNGTYQYQIQILRSNSRVLQSQPGCLFCHIRGGFFPCDPSFPYPCTADNPFIRSIHLSGQPVICYLRRRKTASGTYNSALHIFLQLSGDV